MRTSQSSRWLCAAVGLACVAPCAALAEGAPFGSSEVAFLAGVRGCHGRFEAIKAKQGFDDPRGFPGFTPSPESRTAPGARSLLVNVADALILKADLAADAPGAVFVIVPRGVHPRCHTIATGAGGAHEGAKVWLEASANGWTAEPAAVGPSAQSSTEDRLFSRSFGSGLDLAVTLMWTPGVPQGSLTALSTMTLVRSE